MGAKEEWQEGWQELQHDDVAQEESKMKEWMGGGQEPHAEHDDVDDVAQMSPLKEEAKEEEVFSSEEEEEFT